jgi:hypothetical protein
MSAIAGIQAISFFDRESGSATEGTVVQKNRIVGNQGEAVLQNMITEEDSRGLELHAGDESVFEFACYDDAGDDQLEAWAKADKEIELVVAGVEENILWYEPARISIVKPVGFATKNRNYRRIRITKSGGIHTKIWQGLNLLDGAVKTQGFATGWQDSEPNNIADGYIAVDVSSQAFSSGIQSFDTSGSGAGIHTSVVFPVSGINLQLSSELVSSFSGLARLQFQSRSFANIILQTDEMDISVGRDGLSVELPANVFTLRAYGMMRRSGGSNGTITFRNPALRSSSKEYADY